MGVTAATALLAAADWDEWLDPTHSDLDALQGLLVPAPNDVLVMHAVSTAVNNVRNTGPELMLPAVAARSSQLGLGL